MHNNIELNLMIGERLREARQLCSFSISMAANLLGVEPAELQAIEGGTGATTQLIRKSAEVYAISADYLFGLVNEVCVRDSENLQRLFLSQLQTSLSDTQSQIAAELISQQAQIDALCDAVKLLSPAIDAIEKSVERVRELDPRFDDLKAGNSIISAINKAKKAANQAVIGMIKENLLPVSAMAAAYEN